MKINNIPFTATNWDLIEPVEHQGLIGTAYWRTIQVNDIRVRLVEYSAGYVADHWCSKGHVLFVLSGTLVTELEDGSVFNLNAGMSYQVADDTSPHRSSTKTGAKLFIVD